MSKDVVIYNAAGEPVHTKSTVPDLDPTFFYSLISNASGYVAKIEKEPYAWHSWVYACASRRARTMAKLEAVLFPREDPNKLIFDHKVLNLLAQPNPMMSRSEFIEAVQLNLLLPTANGPGGQCFIIPADSNGEPVDLVRGVLPDELYPFSDRFMTAKEENNRFIGWEFNHWSGRKIFYYPDQIIRIKFYNPYSMFEGLSPMAPLRPTVTNDAKAKEISDKFFDNNAMVGALLTTDEELSDTQLKKMKALWKEQQEGWLNAGKSALLHSGMKLEKVSHSLQDLVFKDQKILNRDEVMAVYGVGKTMMGLSETVNRATAEAEYEIFWQDTMLDDIDRYWDAMNEKFIRFQDKRNLKGYFDLSSVEALKKNQTVKIQNSLKLAMEGVPLNEAFRINNLDTQTANMPWLDEPWVRGQRVNLRTGEMAGTPAGPVPEPEKPKSYPKVHITKDERELIWRAYIEKVLDPPERNYKKTFIKFLNGQRNRFLDAVDEWVERNKAFQKYPAGTSLSDFMIDKKPEDKDLIKVSGTIYQDAIDRQAAQMAQVLGELVNFDTTGAIVEKIKSERYKFLRGINTETFETMGKKIEQILKENPDDTITQLAKKLKEAERAVTTARISSSAQTVARTETSSVASSTRFKIMKAEDVEKHEWVSARDGNERASHMSEDTHIVKIGQPFPVTNLKYPLESGGAAAETINCRCTTLIAA